jgi:hypothetical protein
MTLLEAWAAVVDLDTTAGSAGDVVADRGGPSRRRLRRLRSCTEAIDAAARAIDLTHGTGLAIGEKVWVSLGLGPRMTGTVAGLVHGNVLVAWPNRTTACHPLSRVT